MVLTLIVRFLSCTRHEWNCHSISLVIYVLEFINKSQSKKCAILNDSIYCEKLINSPLLAGASSTMIRVK